MTENSITLTRAVKLGLESSNAKNKQLKTAVEEFQAVTEYISAITPSFPEHEWTTNNNQFYRAATREFSNRDISAACVRNAAQKVVEGFKTWKGNGCPGEKPSFGGGDYLRLTNQEYDLEANDRGYGLKARFIPYNPVWWHLDIPEYAADYINRAMDGDGKLGSLELFYNGGEPFAVIAISWERPMPAVEDVTTTIGVDIGENVIYALAARDTETGDVKDVQIKKGGEFRHHRERLQTRKDELQEKGDLQGVKQTRNERRRYTEQMTHVASREVVDFATQHKPCVIRLEDLTHYRNRATNPIHDWPFAELQDKIAYKAKGEGIPVEAVKPHYTSQTCRECGHTGRGNRAGTEFNCVECGYEIHADVNAAMNIAVW